MRERENNCPRIANSLVVGAPGKDMEEWDRDLTLDFCHPIEDFGA